MRLAVCALSAVLLSGCSWLGMGGHNAGYGQAGGAYGVNCGQAGGGHWQQSQYAGGACGAGGGYGVAGNGYGGAGAYGAGGAGYGMQGAGYGAGGAGYGMQGAGGAGYGMQGAGYGAGAGMVGAGLAANGVGGGMYGANGYGVNGFNGAYGAGGGVTTLGANAGYGSAAYGGNVVGTQYANGQYVQGAGVQTIQGAPYYVRQPYPAYYGVPQLRGVGAAMPWGFEAGIGTEFGIGGDLVTAKPAGPALGSATLGVSATDAIAYKDAFKNGMNYDLATTYDLTRDTTLIGRIGYSKADGERMQIGTINDIPGGGTLTEDLYAEFSDLEQITLEGGLRKYMGGGYGGAFRPYVGATAGFTHTDAVLISQDSATLMPVGSNVQEYVDGGWTPTAAATIGAEMAVGPRSALGVEAGIRWRDQLDTIAPSEDRWSVPVSVRGRVAF